MTLSATVRFPLAAVFKCACGFSSPASPAGGSTEEELPATSPNPLAGSARLRFGWADEVLVADTSEAEPSSTPNPLAGAARLRLGSHEEEESSAEEVLLPANTLLAANSTEAASETETVGFRPSVIFFNSRCCRCASQPPNGCDCREPLAFLYPLVKV